MGLTVDIVEFPSAPPSRAELDAHMKDFGPGSSGIDRYVLLDGNRVDLACDLGPLTRPYALAFLLARGGRCVAVHSHAPVAAPSLPAFVTRRWSSLSWWARLRVRRRGY